MHPYYRYRHNKVIIVIIDLSLLSHSPNTYVCLPHTVNTTYNLNRTHVMYTEANHVSKKIFDFSSLLYHTLQTICTKRTKSLSLLQNLMSFLLNLWKWDISFRAEYISKIQLGTICMHVVDFCRPGHIICSVLAIHTY